MGNIVYYPRPAERRRNDRPRSPPRFVEDPEEPTLEEDEEFNPAPEAGDLLIENIDLMTRENRKKHRTDKYQNKSLIIRRGDSFEVKIKLSDDFNEATDTVICIFSTGKKARIANGTRVRITSREASTWELKKNGGGREVVLEITPDSGAAIGKYKFMVEVRREKSSGKIQHQRLEATREGVILLFNPYCKEDDVYLDDGGKETEEYVQNETGYIFTSGSYGRSWNFGQFQKGILECALHLLDTNGEMSRKPRGKGNIVQVLRALSAMVNSNDGGILQGNWSGEYGGGTSPTKWISSVSIVRQYMNNKSSVKYGQCWVFAAVLTTLCRSLGIATRPITNFSSAHDNDESCTIDSIADDEGNKIGGDSVWNFHVWNEAWSKRPDLPSKYQGSNWQVFDSTPQERSEGIFRCGPCPVNAIHDGDIHIPYDAGFIFSEVNADRVWWRRKRNWEMEIMNIDTNDVGRDMSTKGIGSNYRQDITKNYKDREGTDAERAAVRNAVRQAAYGGGRRNEEKWKLYLAKKKETLHIKLKGRVEGNQDCKYALEVENKDEEKRVVVVRMTMTARYNNGRTGEKLASYHKSLDLGAGEGTTIPWEIPAVDYFSKLDDDCKLFVWASASIEETDTIVTRSKTYDLEKSELKIEVDKDHVKVGEEFTVTLRFTNPVSVRLTNCDVDMEGPGIEKKKDIKVNKTLDPYDTLEERVVLIANVPGEREVVALFDSKELQGISGYKKITVIE